MLNQQVMKESMTYSAKKVIWNEMQDVLLIFKLHFRTGVLITAKQRGWRPKSHRFFNKVLSTVEYKWAFGSQTDLVK